MMIRRSLFTLALPMTLLACGGQEEAPGYTSDSLEAQVSEAALSTAEIGHALTALGTLSEIARGESEDAPRNLFAIGRNLLDFLRCADIGFAAGALRVDFGAGCDIGEVTYSGAWTVGLGFESGFTLELGLEQLSVNDRTYSGTLAHRQARGEFGTDLSLIFENGDSTSELDYSGQTAYGNGERSYTGSGVLVRRGIAQEFEVTELHHTRGDCYPDGGEIRLKRQGLPAVTITLDERTATTGIVTVRIAFLSREVALPPYGNCPAM